MRIDDYSATIKFGRLETRYEYELKFSSDYDLNPNDIFRVLDKVEFEAMKKERDKEGGTNLINAKTIPVKFSIIFDVNPVKIGEFRQALCQALDDGVLDINALPAEDWRDEILDFTKEELG